MENGDKKRRKKKCLCESEIITIVVYFQMSGYRTFKWFYQKHVCVLLRREFPHLPSYLCPAGITVLLN
jgi:hypothetical protein